MTDESLVALAQAYLNANRPDDAIAALRRALDAESAPHRRRRRCSARCSRSAGDSTEAMPLLESAAANGDRNAMTFALLSFGYAQRRRVDESVRMAQQAAALGGSDEQVFLMIGRAMLPIGRLAEAEAYLTRATRAAPNDPEAITRLGIVKAARGDMAAAVGLFRLALTDRARLSAGGPGPRQGRGQVNGAGSTGLGTDGQP